MYSFENLCDAIVRSSCITSQCVAKPLALQSCAATVIVSVTPYTPVEFSSTHIYINVENFSNASVVISIGNPFV